VRKYLTILCVIFFLGISSISCSNDRVSDRDDIDVDFTVLGATIAEALYHNVINNAADYMGQLIRVSGTYHPMVFPQNDNTYHFIVVVPGDECCQLYFEFRLPAEDMNPDSFPPILTLIEVTGVLSRYAESGVSYLYLADSEMIIMN